MDIGDVIERLGGLATRATLIQATSRADVDRALRLGAVVRVGQGVTRRRRSTRRRQRPSR